MPATPGAIADGRDQPRVHERGGHTHRERGHDPARVTPGDDETHDAGRLQPETADDERLAADSVGPGAAGELTEAPSRRVDRGDDADPTDWQTPRGRERSARFSRPWRRSGC